MQVRKHGVNVFFDKLGIEHGRIFVIIISFWKNKS